ncbi:GNAT family N-acetyltransferase [Massilia sp. DJPM01]|uniref:GNAT family N-acetyltransferase n=1 Tax=Massilia sp. DJPM01 TaxID=3024404 RepID=UPI00259EF068|nr:GNAT family N-acetyltransferase [Massilia sp. DJPM01]MDM5179576.1 GNAT family N-acetyltransferase [Massilia sp. DJPM01]
MTEKPVLTLPAPLALRAIGEPDHAFLSALYAGTRDDLALMAAEPAFVAQLIAMQQHVQSQGFRHAFPQAEHAIVECGGQPLGRLVTDTDRERVHLVDLALLPAARARGHGSAVLRALQAWAAGQGLPLRLSVSHANAAAARLYARLGFCIVASDALQQRMQWQAEAP